VVSPSRTSNRTYLKNRAHIYATNDICWICGQFVDHILKWPDPFSPSGDHLIPLSRGGDIAGELQLAHLRCNQRRGRTPPPVRHGRNW
jgi:5-methylcytosine-specific restriction endonuclease McrA